MKNSLFGILIIICFAAAKVSYAGALNIPHTFSKGTPAVAAEVNENFGAIETQVNDHNGRISTIEAVNATQQTQIDNLDTRVSNLEAVATPSPTSGVIGTLQSSSGSSDPYDLLKLSFDVTPPPPGGGGNTPIPYVNNMTVQIQIANGTDLSNLYRDLISLLPVRSMRIELPAQNLTLVLDGVYITRIVYAPANAQNNAGFKKVGLTLLPSTFTLTSADTGMTSIWNAPSSSTPVGEYSSTCDSIPIAYRNSTAVVATPFKGTTFDQLSFNVATSASPLGGGKVAYDPIVLTRVQAASDSPCYIAAAMGLSPTGDVQIELYDEMSTLFTTISLTNYLVVKYLFNVSGDGFKQDIELSYSAIDFTP